MPKLSEDDYKKLYCLWAENHYGLEGVTEVTFVLGTRGPYSDVTPDVEGFVEVSIKFSGIFKSFEEDNVFDLINSINNFITEKVAVGIRRGFILTGKTGKTTRVRKRIGDPVADLDE